MWIACHSSNLALQCHLIHGNVSAYEAIVLDVSYLIQLLVCVIKQSCHPCLMDFMKPWHKSNPAYRISHKLMMGNKQAVVSK